MQSHNIEKTVGQILEIDQNAVEIEKRTVLEKQQFDQQLEQDKKNISFETMKMARKTAQKEKAEIIGKAEKQVLEIEIQRDKMCKELENLLQRNREDVVEKVVSRLFKEVLSQRKEM